jgi:transcriptional regulator with XRE-family HTH domain
MPTPTRPMYKRSQSGGRGNPPTALGRDIAHDYRRIVGAWLCDLRLNAGLTQAELGEILGVGYTAISAVEVGRGSIPPEKYETLADTLVVDREEFGKFVLRYSNPWMYRLLFGDTDKTLRADIEALPPRGRTVRPRAEGKNKGKIDYDTK